MLCSVPSTTVDTHRQVHIVWILSQKTRQPRCKAFQSKSKGTCRRWLHHVNSTYNDRTPKKKWWIEQFLWYRVGGWASLRGCSRFPASSSETIGWTCRTSNPAFTSRSNCASTARSNCTSAARSISARREAGPVFRTKPEPHSKSAMTQHTVSRMVRPHRKSAITQHSCFCLYCMSCHTSNNPTVSGTVRLIQVSDVTQWLSVVGAGPSTCAFTTLINGGQSHM